MRPTKHLAAASFVVAAAVAFMGCGTSQIISNLELAVDAVSVALPLVGPAAGLPVDVQTQVGQYLVATSKAIGQASDILAGPGDDATKAAQITAAFAGIAAPIVPAKYQAIAQAVQQVATLVAKFLGSLPVASTQPIAVRAPGARAALPGQATALSKGDLARLAAVKTKALTQQH
jgi:hypothetical protein